MRLGHIALALALTTLGTVAACSNNSSAGAGGMATPREATTLTVQNQGSLDMTIYAIRGPVGQRIRLGMATSNSTTNLVIPSNLLFGAATSLRFIADPIGGVRNSVSSEILVSPGDNVTLQIPPS